VLAELILLMPECWLRRLASKWYGNDVEYDTERNTERNDRRENVSDECNRWQLELVLQPTATIGVESGNTERKNYYGMENIYWLPHLHYLQTALS
jgi:hypothetical protein